MMGANQSRRSGLSAFGVALATISLVLCAGCASPPVGSMDEPVQQDEIEVRVLGVTLAYLDLEGPTGAQQTQEPLLVVETELTNNSARSLRYDLGWNATSVNQASSALLFVDTGDGQLPPASANAISPVFLGAHRYLADPVTEAATIEPGESLRDLLLFQRPPSGTSALLLSLPPRVFGPDARFPGYLRIPFSAPAQVEEPAPIAIGETWTEAGVSVTLLGSEVLYVPLVEGTDRAGYSAEPLLRIRYRVENRSGRTQTILHTNATAVDLPRMIGDDDAAVSRATFPAGVRAAEQAHRNVQLGTGESVEDFLLFERPTQGVSSVRLLIAGRRFGANGLLRAHIPVEWVEPDLPEALRGEESSDEEAP